MAWTLLSGAGDTDPSGRIVSSWHLKSRASDCFVCGNNNTTPTLWECFTRRAVRALLFTLIPNTWDPRRVSESGFIAQGSRDPGAKSI